MLRTQRFVLALVTLAACSIPAGDFHASIDSGAGGGDASSSDAIQAQPGVLAIVASATAIEVDEGATKDVTVALSQAPSGPLTVSVATTATTKLGISVPTLAFTPSNFSEPQTVTLSGLADVDTTDDHADVTLTAAGVDLVTIATTVRDLDKLSIITSGESPLMIQEGGTVTVNVHLSAQPAGDVAITALLGAGPVTVAPAMRVFTAANYDVDQVFTFSAPLDADTLASDQALTFRSANLADKLFTIHDIDINAQNILVQVSPGNATITEETTTATLDVSLSQMPGPSSTVTVAITTTTGAAHVNVAQLSFNAQTYAIKQTVTIDAVGDQDTADGSDTIKLHATDPDHGGAALDRTVAITIKDNDVQKILENAPSPLAVTETTSAVFAATLQFKPTANVIVNVVALDSSVATASPGTLTFTPANYDQPHNVTVTGVHDNNLVAGTTTVRLSQAAIGTTNVAVNVADVDQQLIVLSTAALAVPEGTSRTFDVSLTYDPGGPVTVNLANTNPTALPIDRSSIAFTSANFSTPVHVTVSPPVDTNASSESATITASGAGAPAAATLTATTSDATVIKTYGFPTPFTGTISVAMDQVIAYKITVDATTNLDSFGVFIPAGTGDFSMALYNDALDQPGARVGFMPVKQAIVNGINTANVPDVNIPLGTYWLAFRAAQVTAVGFSTVGVGRFCVRNVEIPIDSVWPDANFGSVTCSTDHFMNFFINTYHQ